MAERVHRISKRRSPTVEAAETVQVVSGSAFGDRTMAQRTLSVRKFQSDPATVKVSAGTTKQVGDYEYIRVDVAVTVPCYPEEVDAVFEETADKVAGFLASEVEKYLEDSGE